MRNKFLLTLLFCSALAYAQKCGCTNRPELKEIISCEPMIFDNGAKIFWQYDCKGSQLIFQNKNTKKILYQMDKDLIDYTGRLGYVMFQEQPKNITAVKSLISGCCQPQELHLLDKNTSEIQTKLGTIIYMPQDRMDWALTLKNLNLLWFTNLKTNKIYPIKLPQGRLEFTSKNGGSLFPEDQFSVSEGNNNTVLIRYDYANKTSPSKFKSDSITLNLKNYGL